MTDYDYRVIEGLVTRLRKSAGGTQECVDCNAYDHCGAICLFEEAADTIDRLLDERKKRREWTLVSSGQLPQNNVPVAVIDRFDYYNIAYLVGGSDFYVDGECEPDVKWWAALPDPPKDGE